MNCCVVVRLQVNSEITKNLKHRFAVVEQVSQVEGGQLMLRKKEVKNK